MAMVWLMRRLRVGRILLAMDIVSRIVRAEAEFPRSFTNAADRPWGVMYYLPEIADSHDSNHACVFSGDPADVVSEIEMFYDGKELTPRIYQAIPADRPDPLRPALEAAGFSFESHATEMFVHTGSSQIEPNPAVQIRRANEATPDLLEMIERSEGLRSRKVAARRIGPSDYHFLVGYIDGRPVTAGSLHKLGEMTRVDDVLTDIDHRGQGYGRALTHALVTYHAEHIGNTLYLYADNPTAIRIYAEAGFERIDVPTVSYSAWKDGTPAAL